MLENNTSRLPGSIPRREYAVQGDHSMTRTHYTQPDWAICKERQLTWYRKQLTWF